MFNNQYGQGYYNYVNQPIPTNYNMQPQQNLIRVTGIEGAKTYQMSPNSIVALFDANDDIFYVKSTDGAGFPTINTFRFTSVSNVDEKSVDYVTRDEFNELKEMIQNGKLTISAE